METTAVTPTVDMKTLIDDAQKLHTDLLAKHTAVAERNEKLYKRLGLEYDGEEKHNLKEMAGKLADLEVTLQKMRRTRTSGIPEAGELEDDLMSKGLSRGSKSRHSYFEDPRDEASFVVRGTKEYRRALNRALRKGGDRFSTVDAETYGILTFKSIPDRVAGIIPDEVKSALSTEFEPGAGFFAPPTMETEIDRLVIESSPLAALCREVTIGTGSYEGLIRNLNRDTVTNGRGEREARGVGNVQLKRYEKRRIDVHESTAEPAVTQTMLEDSYIDLASELQSDATEDFAVDEGRKLVKGSGVDEAEGLMVSEELKVMASGLAATFDMNAIKRLPQQLKTIYKAGGSYALSRDALTTLMLFRVDSGNGANTGPYMWEPSTQAGTPSRLNGFEWVELVDMDDVAAGAFPVGFGNLYAAYRVVRRRGIRILRDELTDKPNVIFYMTKRYGGRVWKGEAFCKLKCAVSLP